MSRSGFNNEDFFNLIVIYGECDRVINRTCEVFRTRYPNRPAPSYDTVKRLIHNCKTYGSFTTKTEKDKPVVNQEINEINVL